MVKVYRISWISQDEVALLCSSKIHELQQFVIKAITFCAAELMFGVKEGLNFFPFFLL